MKNVLVIGANGRTGRILVQKLKERQEYTPIAMIRDKEQENFFKELGVKSVVGDLEKDFSHAFEGVDYVIFAAGSGSKTGKDKTILVDKEGAKRSIDYARAKGVQKYVMLSAKGAENAHKADESIIYFLSAKFDADEYLKFSGLPFAIVRPGKLTNGPQTNKIKIEPIFNQSGDISRKDVAEVLIYMLSEEAGTDLTFELLSGENEIPEAFLMLKNSKKTHNIKPKSA